MKAFILATTLTTAIMACASEGPAKPITAPIPKPLTAVAFTQCNLLVVAYVTFTDGELIHYDFQSGLPLSQILALVESAPHHEQANICPGEKST